MDYDKSSIASVYDAGRSYIPEVLRQWLDLLALHAPATVQHIVDLGCGTGRYSQALALHFEANVTAIDPSMRMLEQARKKTTSDRVVFLQSSGEQIPVGDRSADLVFMSMVIHHLPDMSATAYECLRVLRSDGRVCIRNSTVDTAFPELDFFPGLPAFIERELPSRQRIKDTFEAVGFEMKTHLLVRHVMAANWTAYAEKLALRANSFLARLSAEEFETGIARLRAYAEVEDPKQDVFEEIAFFVFNKCNQRGGATR
jgi:ubiquinone/menaquinone biosynthesis C-methylase UbiE